MSDKLAALHDYKQFVIYELIKTEGKNKKDKIRFTEPRWNKHLAMLPNTMAANG